MSDPNADRYDALLDALLAREISPDDERVQDMISQSEEFRERWESLARLQSHLRHEDEERDEVLEGLAADSSADIDPKLEDAFRRIATGSPQAPASGAGATRSAHQRRIGGWWIVAAAAVLLAAVWMPWSDLRDWVVPRDQHLGRQEELVDLHPSGPVKEYGTFRWSAPEGVEGVTYRLRILDANGRQIRDFARIGDNEFTPTVELPARIVWRVTARDAADVTIASGEAEAYLEE